MEEVWLTVSASRGQLGFTLEFLERAPVHGDGHSGGTTTVFRRDAWSLKAMLSTRPSLERGSTHPHQVPRSGCCAEMGRRCSDDSFRNR